MDFDFDFDLDATELGLALGFGEEVAEAEIEQRIAQADSEEKEREEKPIESVVPLHSRHKGGSTHITILSCISRKRLLKVRENSLTLMGSTSTI